MIALARTVLTAVFIAGGIISAASGNIPLAYIFAILSAASVYST